MWPIPTTNDDIIVEGKGELADQLNLLKQYRLTGERMLFESVVEIRDAIATNAMPEVHDSAGWIRLNRELFLLTGDVKYIDAIDSACRNTNNKTCGFTDVMDLTVTRDVNHTLFVNLYPNCTIEMDGVRFAISSESPANGKVKVRTYSAIARNVRFRIPVLGNRPAKYIHRRIKAGEEAFELP
jgi:hypothetical protein